MPLPKEQTQQLTPWEEWLALPDTTMAEFIDGQIYMMATPNRRHQTILRELHTAIHSHIRAKGGECRVYPAPFGVKLIKEDGDFNILEPDISVICDKSKLTKEGCTGGPDWIIEIASPSDPKHDYIDKLKMYRDGGVRDYWIVDPMEERITVYPLEDEDFRISTYTFADRVKAGIWEDFSVDFAEIAVVLEEESA